MTNTATPTLEALITAVAAGDTRAIPGLRTAPGARTFRDEQGRTLVHLAAISGSTDALNEMLMLNIDPTATDNDGKTALDLASTDPVRGMLTGAPGHAHAHFVRMREALAAGDADALTQAHEDWDEYIEDLLDSGAAFETWHWGIPGWSTWDGELLRAMATRVGGSARNAAYGAVDAMRASGSDRDEDEDFDE